MFCSRIGPPSDRSSLGGARPCLQPCTGSSIGRWFSDSSSQNELLLQRIQSLRGHVQQPRPSSLRGGNFGGISCRHPKPSMCNLNCCNKNTTLQIPLLEVFSRESLLSW